MTAPTCNCGEEMDVEEGRLFDVVRCSTGDCRAEGVRLSDSIRERWRDPSSVEVRLANLLELRRGVLEAVREFDVQEARDELVDRLVIRGECVHEPCVSEGWMKARMLALGLAPPLLVMALLEALGAPAYVTVAVAMLLGGGLVRMISVRINVVAASTECERQDFYSDESGS